MPGIADGSLPNPRSSPSEALVDPSSEANPSIGTTNVRIYRDPRGPGGRFSGSARDRASTPPTSRVLDQWLVRTFDQGGEPVE